jgi:catalase-peroxidase
MDSSSQGKCPVMHGSMTTKGGERRANHNWWPNQLNLAILHQHTPVSSPLDENFNYAEAFKKLDLAAVKKRSGFAPDYFPGPVAR